MSGEKRGGMNRRQFMGTVAGAAAVGMFGLSSLADVGKKGDRRDIRFDEIYGYVPEINLDKDEFSFCVWADPQVGDASLGKDMARADKPTVGRLLRAIGLTNGLDPSFVLVLGDIVHGQGQMKSFRRYVETCSVLKPAQYLLAGNHDFVHAWWSNGLYESEEGAEFFGNFRWAQRQVNGLDRVNYSFDAGRWHVIMFSIPGVHGLMSVEFLKMFPEHTAWLEKDLAAHKDKPTIFCTHHPLLPVGRKFFEYYGPNARQRRELVEMITRHGNVRLCLFGHVHNTVSSIPEIAWRYRGASWVTLPTSSFGGVRSMDYNEDGESSFGVARIRVKGDEIGPLEFHTLADEVFSFALNDFPEYDHEHTTHLWQDAELPANPEIVNGSFEAPLTTGWFVKDILESERPPEAERTVTEEKASDGKRSLWMFCGGTGIRGKWPTVAHYVEIKQAVVGPGGDEWPVLGFECCVPRKRFSEEGARGVFVLVTGHRKDEWSSHRRAAYQFRLQYGLGYPDPTPVTSPYVESDAGIFRSDPVFDKWERYRLNIRRDFERTYPGRAWSELNLDSVVITLGVWNARKESGERRERAGTYFDNVRWGATGEKVEETSPAFELISHEQMQAMVRADKGPPERAPVSRSAD
jgi:hypothetical protein